tara:strand:- start:562 stop:696 length:135 start_codon:yes stop_codon:yes gene_type:complete
MRIGITMLIVVAFSSSCMKNKVEDPMKVRPKILSEEEIEELPER